MPEDGKKKNQSKEKVKRLKTNYVYKIHNTK